MKKLLAIALIFLCFTAVAGDKDKTPPKVTHHVQFMFGEYVGQSAVHSTISDWGSHLYTPPGQLNYGSGPWLSVYNKPTFLPMLSYNVGFDYLVAFGSRYALRTGLEYFTYG